MDANESNWNDERRGLMLLSLQPGTPDGEELLHSDAGINGPL